MLASIDSSTGSNLETVKLLINAGSDLNIKTNDGRVALMMTKCPIVIKLLIDAGVDVNLKNSNEQNYLSVYLQNRVVETDILVELIHKSKQTLSDTDFRDKTAYDYHIQNNHNLLDEYQLKILQGAINPNNTKSARSY